MRVLIQHVSRYAYPKPASLGPHVIRLRPASHAKARIETYALEISPEPLIRWQQDPYGNRIARISYDVDQKVDVFEVAVEMAVEVRPINPFDFYLETFAEKTPFEYPKELEIDIAPFRTKDARFLESGKRTAAFLAELPEKGNTIDLLVELNRRVNQRIKYVLRDEPGIWTPEETLEQGRGSCRDLAVLLIAALRSRGLAARFSSGYLVQLKDEGMIPDEPKGIGRDVVDLHAWVEVFLPGAGWIGLDPTSGLLAGEGHVPLACTSAPALAVPIEGTSDTVAEKVSFESRIGRLGHETRPTEPYEAKVWDALLAAGDRADEALVKADLVLTMGGEPTFNSREHPDAPEWNGAALGPTKTQQGRRLARELLRRLGPGGVIIQRMGKRYPGESLPRWALDLWSRRDGRPLFRETARSDERTSLDARAGRFAEVLARRLDLAGAMIPAYEDPWRFLQDEASLPVDVDPLRANLDDAEERRRLARVLDRGLGKAVGWVLPLMRRDSRWITERWRFRRERLFLLQGDSPVGLRLPLASLAFVPPPEPKEEPLAHPALGSRAGEAVPPLDASRSRPDPRRAEVEKAQQALLKKAQPRPADRSAVRTALTVEPREGAVFVFLPPLETADDFFRLMQAIDEARIETSTEVQLEGYPPPKDPALVHLSVTPDPGVLEVNIAPSDSVRAYARDMEIVFDGALHAGLHAEKYLLDGRMSGSGGGNHLTLGGPTPLSSPFVRRPDLLASMLVFLQHHPSLSYMFTGLFVGPTSQAPRIDEARHDALYELEIALERAFEQKGEPPAPWLGDMLFRHLLCDVSGNTHRTEVSIDKLFDWQAPYGRQGLLELRAFEMPPHIRMAIAQMLLVRSLVAAFAKEPYQHPLIRWGTDLHDRFLLPHFMWRDFTDVLAFLEARGLPLPSDGYRPFIELRCPLAGRLEVPGVVLEVRNAIEPWNVLGEETVSTGTARFVDSSMERIEVRAMGLVEGRHLVRVNGYTLPMHATGTSGERVAGIRFRAWAPPHSLHAHLGIHHPIRLDVVDRWARRSLGGCAYHVWHPEGRAYDTPPLTRFEASARRAQRFTVDALARWPIDDRAVPPSPEATFSLDLRRLPIDRPPPEPTGE
jgi:uncharacterized protein (DUF2126 family)/transglutaminase-like putative cysteine protease